MFISYSSRDRDTARRLKEALSLRRPNFSYFFDEDRLTGGVYWMPRLSEEIGKADVILLLLGQTVGAWQQLEYSAALELSQKPGRADRPRIVPVVIADHPAPGLPFLSTLHQIFALKPTSVEALTAIERALSAAPSGEVTEPWRRFESYKGLPALIETDAAFFFGRGQETAELLDLLSRTRSRIITLIGQSGVGKSSLVFAGVLSKLKSQLWPLEGGRGPEGSRTAAPICS